jgi:hypothetical protein
MIAIMIASIQVLWWYGSTLRMRWWQQQATKDDLVLERLRVHSIVDRTGMRIGDGASLHPPDGDLSHDLTTIPSVGAAPALSSSPPDQSMQPQSRPTGGKKSQAPLLRKRFAATFAHRANDGDRAGLKAASLTKMPEMASIARCAPATGGVVCVHQEALHADGSCCAACMLLLV